MRDKLKLFWRKFEVHIIMPRRDIKRFFIFWCRQLTGYVNKPANDYVIMSFTKKDEKSH